MSTSYRPKLNLTKYRKPQFILGAYALHNKLDKHTTNFKLFLSTNSYWTLSPKVALNVLVQENVPWNYLVFIRKAGKLPVNTSG